MANDPDKYSEEETVRRREAGLKKLLAMPPKPHPKKDKPTRSTRSKKARVEEFAIAVDRLRTDIAFLSRVARQLRDMAIAAHVIAERRG